MKWTHTHSFILGVLVAAAIFTVEYFLGYFDCEGYEVLILETTK